MSTEHNGILIVDLNSQLLIEHLFYILYHILQRIRVYNYIGLMPHVHNENISWLIRKLL